jgi:hypothetical protein
MEAGERDEVAAELSAWPWACMLTQICGWRPALSQLTHSVLLKAGWNATQRAHICIPRFVPGVKKTFIVPAAGSSFMRRVQELSQFDNRVSRSSHSDHAIL